MRTKVSLLIPACILAILLGIFIGANFIEQGPGDQAKDEAPADLDRSRPLAKDPEVVELQKTGRSRPLAHRVLREPEAEVPLWAVTVGPVKPGTYTYCFVRDGQPMTDPLNPRRREDLYGWPSRASIFTYPLADMTDSGSDGASPPERNPVPGERPDSIRFVYRGSISQSLLFVAGFRGGVWGTDELEPLNEPARENLRRIRNDRRLCRLSGVVTDPDGRSIASALVRTYGDVKHYRTVPTGVSGGFLVDRLPPGRVYIEARAPGHFMRRPLARSLVSQATENRVKIVLGRGGGARGTVRDAAGKPAPAAKITTQWLDEPREWLGLDHARFSNRPEAWTDSSGRYEFPGLPSGKYWFWAQAHGFCTARYAPVEILAGEVIEGIDFTLLPGMTLSGSVVREEDGADRPVPEATVMIWGDLIGPTRSVTNFSGPIEVVTGADGRFAVEHLAPGCAYLLRARKGSSEMDDVVQRELIEDREPDPVILRLPSEGSIVGWVVNQDRLPVAGASLRLLARYTDSGSRHEFKPGSSVPPPGEARTEPNGNFRIAGLARGQFYDLLIAAETYAPLRVDKVPADASREQEFVLSRGATLNGRVVSAEGEEPIVDVDVYLRSGTYTELHWEAKSDLLGEFQISELPAGPYMIGGKRDEVFEPWVVQPIVGLQIKEGIENTVTLEAFPPPWITGTVRDEKNEPVPYAEVTFSNQMSIGSGFYPVRTEPELALVGRTVCGGDGRYQLTNILHGRLMGNAKKEGYRSEFELYIDDTDPFDLGTERGKSVPVKPGETLTGIDFTLYRQDPRSDVEEKAIQGIALYPDGRPAPGIEIATYYVSGANGHCSVFRTGVTAITDSSGRFEIVERRKKIRGLVVLPTEDQPYCGWYQGDPSLHVEVTLNLIPCGRVVGIVGDRQGNPIPGADVHLQWDQSCNKYRGITRMGSTTDSEGVFDSRLLPPGEYRIYAYKSGYDRGEGGEATRKLSAGQTIDDLVLVLNKAGSFEGRLVDQFGKPLAGWRAAHDTTAPDGTFSYQLSTQVKSLSFVSEARTRAGNVTRVSQRTTFRTGTIDYPGEEPRDNQDFVLHVGGIVTGRVVYADTKRPAGGLDLKLQDDSSKRREPVSFGDCALGSFTFRSDSFTEADGSFEITGVPVGAFVLTLSGKGIAPKSVRDITVGENLRTDVGVILVSRADPITLVGRLIHGLTGEPIYGAEFQVAARGIGSSGSSLALDFQPPDHAGRFRITSVPEELESVIATARGLRDDSYPWAYSGSSSPELFGEIAGLDLSDRGEIDVGDVSLVGYELRCRLFDEEKGEALGKSEIRSLDIDVRTNGPFPGGDVSRVQIDDTGGISAGGVPPGVVDVRIKIRDFLTAEIESVPPPDAAGVIDLGVVPLDRGCTVCGVLRGPNGETVRYADVQITDSRESYAHGETNAKGEFEMSGLFPGPATFQGTAQNWHGSNPWIGGDDSSAVHIDEYSFTILEGNATILELDFPAPKRDY